MNTMTPLFLILSVQAAMGAFDNLWHHELHARLPQRVSARRELALHAAREAIYGVIFLGLAWWQWHGAFAVVLATLLLVELVITLADFLEEDRTRHLPGFERVLHTLLTISYGLFLALVGPVLWAWAQRPSAMLLTPHGPVSWLFTLFAVGVWAWSIRNAIAVVQLGRKAAPPAPAGPQGDGPPSPATGPATLVTGATGFLGSALVDDLVRTGQRVIVLSRDALGARAHLGAGVWVVDSLDAIPAETPIDAVVHLAGARVLGMPWTPARRRSLLRSRVDTTTALMALMQRLQRPPRVLVSASAVGYYGATPHASMEPRDESAPPRPGEFQSDLCRAIEDEAQRAQALGVRVVCLRLGVVLGHGGGAYPLQALAARFGLGAILGRGQQPAPWIHISDAVGLIRFGVARDDVRGAVNAVAPQGVTQAQFVQELAASQGRRARWSLPAWPLRALLGEMSTLLLDGQNAVPRAATMLGYRFVHPDLPGGLQALSGRRPQRARAQEPSR